MAKLIYYSIYYVFFFGHKFIGNCRMKSDKLPHGYIVVLVLQYLAAVTLHVDTEVGVYAIINMIFIIFDTVRQPL
jgi:hypothetical protein